MIVTVTLNPAVDYTVQLDEGPTPGAVARTDAARFDPGGKGINVSKYLIGLDIDTTATGIVGDFPGRYLTASLTDDGIPNDFVEISGRTRLNTTVLTPDSEYKINQDGPVVDDRAVDGVVEKIRRHDPETVVVAGSLPPNVGSEAIDRITTAGPWRTVVDLNGSLLCELEADYALCKPNKAELADATGRSVETVEEGVAAARTLQQRGFERVVASLGPDGAVMVTPDAAFHTSALDADIVDTVGAGDALLAGTLAQRRLDGSDESVLRAGVAVAARVVAVSGTRVPSLTDIRAEMDEIAINAH